MRGIRTDEETEGKAIELYTIQRLAPLKVGEELGIGEGTVRRILARKNVQMRTKSEAMTRFPKKNFSNSPEETAAMVATVEDCAVGRHFNLIRIRTSSTHLPIIDMFTLVFGNYGHIHVWPRYHNRTGAFPYAWTVDVLLNSSFEFLLDYNRDPVIYLEENLDPKHYMVYDAYLLCSEGSIQICVQKNFYFYPLFTIANNNRRLLEWEQNRLGGFSTDYNGAHNLVIFGNDAVEILRRLHLVHEEKIAARQLVLYYADSGGFTLESLEAYRSLRRRIDEEVRLWTWQARLEYVRRKGKPHPKDPDQTVPQNSS